MEGGVQDTFRAIPTHGHVLWTYQLATHILPGNGSHFSTPPHNFFVYMDDLLIATNGDVELHRHIVDQVLETLRQESYFLQPSKCKFEQMRIEYLGLIVDGDKLTIDPKKADGLCNWPRTLKTVKEVRSILGVLGYQ